MSDSVRPHRWQPMRLHRPWDSPGKNTGVGRHFLLQCMKVKSESEVTQSCPTLSDPMDYSPPGPPSMGFSRQEYWSGVPLPSGLWHLLNPAPSSLGLGVVQEGEPSGPSVLVVMGSIGIQVWIMVLLCTHWHSKMSWAQGASSPRGSAAGGGGHFLTQEAES